MSWTKLNYTEPAVLRGIVAAVVGLATSLGVTLPTDLPGQLDAAIVALAAGIPLLQGVWTRLAVWSPKSKDQAVARPLGEPQRPGLADHGA